MAESREHMADRRALWKSSSAAEKFVLQALQFQVLGVCH
jgi:hypothetical protein